MKISSELRDNITQNTTDRIAETAMIDAVKRTAKAMDMEFADNLSAIALGLDGDVRNNVDKTIIALAEKYRDKPLPPLSAELRAKLGAGIPEIK